MNFLIHYLRRLCRPNQATPVEIVHAAWQLAQEEKLSAHELLAKVPECKIEICAAASYVSQNILGDNIGFVTGAGGLATVETDSSFVPRNFVIELMS